MFIVDCAMLNNTICVTKDIGIMIIEKYKIPILSYDKEHYIFSNTKELNDIIINLSDEIKNIVNN